MGFWNKIVGEFVDIVEWIDDTHNTLVWRFERYQNEIKNGAQLTVRQGQVAIFVNEGQIADVFEPGMYSLTTANLPILSTLKGWKHGFNSPFKAEVYFISMRLFTDNKWGTRNPILLRDPEFGPIRIRAFGNYDIRVDEPLKLLEQVVGTDGCFQIENIQGQLRTMAVSRFTDAVAESGLPVLDMAANYDEFALLMQQKMNLDFATYGLTLEKFLVENISLPAEVEEALDKRSSMGIIGNLNQYTQYQAAEALEAAASNGDGTANAGMEMGMGFAMAQQMAQSMNPVNTHAQPASQHAAPPPLPQSVYFVAIDGKQTGPFSIDAIQQQAMDGRIQPHSLVWKQGMASWTKVSEVSELQGFFQATPPPIPGA
ncbi:SPFH domain-containing protein [Vibrio renipiscarius]|uniref:Antifreeze protein n=1 Tax=Vibrio renipiscarius TaxID=1461322 RepID=A0A0C2JVP8_9VIBR|nr:SPFH domain-containing protein [Vibrio renipiscarius]KII75526.1 antifreeze protein [Vibrio renipiscarius]KII82024.1 antifreeze protein [Vibrio renipiscarius]